MKAIFTVISIIGFQYLLVSQTNISNNLTAKSREQCQSNMFFVLVDSQCHAKAGFVQTNQNKEIVITKIPDSSLPLNTLSITFYATGSFVFKKHESLKIPENQEVFIEDKLTGTFFNLINGQTYKFNVQQNVPNRFVMHVLNKPDFDEVVAVNN